VPRCQKRRRPRRGEGLVLTTHLDKIFRQPYPDALGRIETTGGEMLEVFRADYEELLGLVGNGEGDLKFSNNHNAGKQP